MAPSDPSLNRHRDNFNSLLTFHSCTRICKRSASNGQRPRKMCNENASAHLSMHIRRWWSHTLLRSALQPWLLRTSTCFRDHCEFFHSARVAFHRPTERPMHWLVQLYSKGDRMQQQWFARITTEQGYLVIYDNCRWLCNSSIEMSM